MRRLLSWAVATELALASVLVVAADDRGAGPSAGAGRVRLAAPIGARDGVVGGGASGTRPSGRTWPGGRRASVGRNHPFAVDEMRSGSAGRGAGRISLAPPVDFATGAVPPSTGFNMASGDQLLPLTLARAPLSDSVAVGDFNRDRKTDVAQTNVIAGTVSVFLGDGRGGFAPPQPYVVGVHPTFVVGGDLDRDGSLDLAVANFGSGQVAVLRGSGDGTFLPASFTPVAAPRNVAIGEFNGDGILDLAVTSTPPTPPNDPTQGIVTILTGSASGMFTPAQRITTTVDGRGVKANFVAAGDFDHDGGDDLAVGVGTSNNAGDRQTSDPTKLTGDDVLIFRNQRRPGTTSPSPFGAEPDQRIRVGAWPTTILVERLDGDADVDLAVLDSASGDVTTLLGDGRGRFTPKATNVTVGAQPRHLASGDLDHDGVADLVTASFQASTASVLRGNGDGTFEPAVDFWSGDAPTGVAVGDVDADSRPDVVVARLRNDHLALLRNEGPRPGDGVVVRRDVSYGPTQPTDDPLAAHHTLDVYLPPEGTPSFVQGRPYPVVFLAHGGNGISGDKSTHSLLMRRLAMEGLVAISVNYRLGSLGSGIEGEQTKDVAQAFRWIRANVGSPAYGGDPANIVAIGYSAGAGPVNKLATDAAYSAEQRSIRALVVVSALGQRPGDTAELPPSLVLDGTEALALPIVASDAGYVAESQRRGAKSEQVIVAGRDHLTLISDMALVGDPARVALMRFLRSFLAPSA